MPDWTPYGLEAIRIAHLRRRRLIAALVLLGMLGLWFTMFQTTTESQYAISVNGQDSLGGITIQPKEGEAKKDHVTVSLRPGEVSRVDTGQDIGAEEVNRNSAPVVRRATPIPWNFYLLQILPWALLGAAVWWLGRRRGKYDEVNFGVYKGTMPLEMITASHQGQVFTRRTAAKSIFGKRRVDHVPAEAAAAAREEDG